MILFFSYFWTATQFNELQIADDLKKNGGYVPGVRPGQATSDLFAPGDEPHHPGRRDLSDADRCHSDPAARATCTIPYTVAQFFGGTSMLITVGVLLDTMRQMESHLMMRHYDGFLRGGRGRRRPRLRAGFDVGNGL